jgi:hypothetical protein
MQSAPALPRSLFDRLLIRSILLGFLMVGLLAVCFAATFVWVVVASLLH